MLSIIGTLEARSSADDEIDQRAKSLHLIRAHGSRNEGGDTAPTATLRSAETTITAVDVEEVDHEDTGERIEKVTRTLTDPEDAPADTMESEGVVQPKPLPFLSFGPADLRCVREQNANKSWETFDMHLRKCAHTYCVQGLTVNEAMRRCKKEDRQ